MEVNNFSFNVSVAVMHAVVLCRCRLLLMLTALDERMGRKLRELIYKGLVS